MTTPRRGPLHRDEAGTILPLVLGYAVLSLVLLFVCVNATSLYLAQKRADGIADAAAVAAADGVALVVRDGVATAALTDAEVSAQARHVVDAVRDVELVAASTPDGASVRVTVATRWHPPIVSPFVPGGVALEATATSRTALR
ncbi:pilus assembly protein TadG-related protein [Microbacterium sp. No. 7]|uniref:pilus assembly protein TadG-related protein n=1 Tax=Microbacterium sp. No. 7 TaxID=1714373 RepID=UPI0006ED2F3B|nr:pilus assembly protein TadG-related protein [Microbacterium sp. No. 7]ALJ20010.1 hypothetical protein AOA12_08850 [Microbacterium sp. No. 7]